MPLCIKSLLITLGAFAGLGIFVALVVLWGPTFLLILFAATCFGAAWSLVYALLKGEARGCK